MKDEPLSQNTSSTSNQGIDEQHRSQHKTGDDRTNDGQTEGTTFNATHNDGDRKGFAEHANDKTGLNEDKSTVSDTSAPSASMQDKAGK